MPACGLRHCFLLEINHAHFESGGFGGLRKAVEQVAYRPGDAQRDPWFPMESEGGSFQILLQERLATEVHGPPQNVCTRSWCDRHLLVFSPKVKSLH